MPPNNRNTLSSKAHFKVNAAAGSKLGTVMDSKSFSKTGLASGASPTN